MVHKFFDGKSETTTRVKDGKYERKTTTKYSDGGKRVHTTRDGKTTKVVRTDKNGKKW